MSIVQPTINENDLKPLANLINARIGVGIARSGRTAMKLATEALDILRSRNGHGVMMLKEN